MKVHGHSFAIYCNCFSHSHSFLHLCRSLMTMSTIIYFGKLLRHTMNIIHTFYNGYFIMNHNCWCYSNESACVDHKSYRSFHEIIRCNNSCHWIGHGLQKGNNQLGINMYQTVCVNTFAYKFKLYKSQLTGLHSYSYQSVQCAWVKHSFTTTPLHWWNMNTSIESFHNAEPRKGTIM